MIAPTNNSILADIILAKKLEVGAAKKVTPLADIKQEIDKLPPARTFASQLRRQDRVALIAEVKRRSPSKGLLRHHFDVPAIARDYTQAGAAALSVLIDQRFFGGDPGFIVQARENSDLPILCKEFIVDPYQIYQARLLGADAILLIVKVLTGTDLDHFTSLAKRLGLEVLVETNTSEEIKQALQAGAKIIGINNRNLDTFQTDIDTTLSLRHAITEPEITVVSESGIRSHNDMKLLKEHGIHAALVGETLMRRSDIKQAVRELTGFEGNGEVN